MLMWSIAILNGAVVALAVFRMSRFVKRNPVIAIPEDLERYQSLVTQLMWGALVLMGGSVAVPFAVIAPSILEGHYVPPNWYPIGLMLIPALLSKQTGKVEGRVRALQVTPAFAFAYEAINKVWVTKAFPRFERLPTSLESTRASIQVTYCPKHGERVAAALCASCGAVHCARCSAEQPQVTATCAACAARFRATRSSGYTDELAVRRSAYLLMALGISDFTFGAFTLLAGDLIPLQPLAVGLLLVGPPTSLAGLMLNWRIAAARRFGIACAATHVLAFPVGTAVSVWVIVTLRRCADVLSPSYLDAVRQTSGEVSVPWIRYMLLSNAVVMIYGATLFAYAFVILWSSAPAP